MTANELEALAARIFKANAARDLATNYTRAFNAIANDKNRIVKVTATSLWVESNKYGDGQEDCGAAFDTAELRGLIVNYLVGKQQEALKEWEAA